jgi:uncharacterized protein (TIGR01777 family)
MKKVLVAGATGMVGRKLVAMLNEAGYEVNALSTRKNTTVQGAEVFFWNPKNFEIDAAALVGVSSIINLAGATVSKRWTTEYKQEIYDSRTQTAETLYKALSKNKNHSVKSYISASAVGYYASDLSNTYSEKDEPGSDFLAQVCIAWEKGADLFLDLNLRVVKHRIGIVLSREGGVLKELEPITKLGLAAPLGTGEHWMSWIHVDDLCGMIFHTLENESLEGPFNAAAPNPVTNKAFTKTMATALNRPAFLPNVPSFVLKALLGQMAQIAFMSQKVSAKKIIDAGYKFKYNTLPEALKALY